MSRNNCTEEIKMEIGSAVEKKKKKRQGYSSSLLSKMREGRKSYPAVFMKFVRYKDLHSTHAFCFYEGEDGMYYDRRIEEYLNDGDRFVALIAGNKQNVLKAMQKICADSNYDSVRKMFFVDRDYDTLQACHKDLYETPGYSIENFYVNGDAFRRVLRSAFYINECDPDFAPCINAYRETFKQFHEVILPFNALVKYKHLYAPDNTNCCFSDVSDSHLSSITIGGAVKAPKHDEELQKLGHNLRPDTHILAEIEADLSRTSNPYYTYRGKNELYCLTQLLEKMRDEYNKPETSSSCSFFRDRQKRVKLPASNNSLGTLSQFASTPQDLIDFIIAHRPLAA